MPAPLPTRQPAPPPNGRIPNGSRPNGTYPVGALAAWFATPAGRAVLDSEADAVREALDERPGQPWLCLSASATGGGLPGRGFRLLARGPEWGGDLRCALPLPLCSESVGTVVLQHVGDQPMESAALLEECARVLVPGGRAWLFALNPLTPYRRHWIGSPLVTSEPLRWRRRLRAAGLEPEPVSMGLGPRWHVAAVQGRQDGPGLRAAWLVRARKQVAAVIPPAPVPSLRWQPGLTA